MEKVRNWIQGLSKKQMMIGVSICAVIIISIIAGMVFYNHQMDLRRVQKEQEEKESKQKVVIQEKEEEEEIEEVVEIIQPTRTISFSGTSIERDLKIKIVDESATLVSGVAFKVTVFLEGQENKGKEYADEDMDGIIHLQGIDAGKYTVKLHEMEYFVITQNPITMEVKAKIEYTKVNVADEIKKESEINTKVEETVENKVPIEKPVTNTVTFLESKTLVSAVEKQNVSMENFTPAFASEEKHEETFGSTQVQVPQAVTLYSQGDADSKNYTIIPYDSSLREATIQSVSWEWDDKAVINLIINEDRSATLEALQNGTATITVKIGYMDENAALQEKVWAIAVQVSDMTDSETQLKDSQGFNLYLDNEGKTAATLADYGKQDVFYSLKYTGWQTLNGKVYYFDENYQFVTGDQVIGSIKYSFREDGTLVEALESRGIDVSKWQGNIDWKAVAGAGIDFAIIRVGYRGYTMGSLIEDSCYRKNIVGATKAGIKVGVYFTTQAITETEAVEEASMALEYVRGYHLDYPIFIDTEWSGGYPEEIGRADRLNKAQRTKIVKAFCRTIQNSGYKAGVYASKYWYQDNLYADELNDYVIWVAQYNTECTYTGKYDMWQYTKTGTVPGINGNVDMNVFYRGK